MHMRLDILCIWWTAPDPDHWSWQRAIVSGKERICNPMHLEIIPSPYKGKYIFIILLLVTCICSYLLTAGYFCSYNWILLYSHFFKIPTTNIYIIRHFLLLLHFRNWVLLNLNRLHSLFSNDYTDNINIKFNRVCTMSNLFSDKFQISLFGTYRGLL